jgi:ABC-2 type transport system ATP-binding protein
LENDIVVEVTNLRKQFNTTVAVDGISFQVKRGEIVGLLGANGAGKTTTMHMLLGIVTPSSGTIKIFSQDPERKRIETLKRMNFASAYQFLSANLHVWENLYIFAEIYQIKDGKKKIEHLLDLFELSHLKNKSTGGLSSGEQTRLNLCKSLINDPELLLLDEPTASLDPYIADKVRKILAHIHEQTNMTIINTSHNMTDVHELCERVLFMQQGKIIAQGTSDEIMNQFGSNSLDEVFITMAGKGATKQ